MYTLNELRADWIDNVYQDGVKSPMLRIQLKVDRHGPDGREDGLSLPALLLERYSAENLADLLRTKLGAPPPGQTSAPELDGDCETPIRH
nr:hypothetical protein [uncultured Rhodoferax sp.]